MEQNIIKIEIKVAKHAGFCFGVKRAIEIAEEVAQNNKGKTYVYGQLVHNEKVIRDLEKKGMITSFTKNNVTHFDAVEPDDIVELCNQRVKEMERLQKNASELKEEFKAEIPNDIIKKIRKIGEKMMIEKLQSGKTVKVKRL